MAHEIGNKDVQAGTQMAWHRLTTVVPTVTREVAFPFEINRVSLNSAQANDVIIAALRSMQDISEKHAAGGKGITRQSMVDAGAAATAALAALEKSKVPGFSVFVSDDDQSIVGRPMAETYCALKNEEFWNICSDALAGTGAIIESAGTIMNRTRRFMTIRLSKDSMVKIGDREFQNRISMVDSIDGTTRFFMVNTSTCVVCANTARMVMGDMRGEFNVAVKHTLGMPSKIENLERQIEGMVGVQAQFNAALSMANEEALSIDGARQLFAGWLGEDATDGLSTRAVNTAEELVKLFVHGRGNAGETLLDGISAVTDYYTHLSSGGKDKPGFLIKQHESSEFGKAARSKTDFLTSLFSVDRGAVKNINRENVTRLQNHGQKLLLDYAKAN